MFYFRYNRDIATYARQLRGMRIILCIGVALMGWFLKITLRRYAWLAGLGMSVIACIITVTLVLHDNSSLSNSELSVEKELEQVEQSPLAPAEFRTVALSYRNRNDLSLTYLRAPEARADVIAFYTALINSSEIAEVIIREAEAHGVSPSLAVALVWEESRFVRTAVNRNRSSIDRGLFQLNNRSFPKLDEVDFFDIEINTQNGIAHLKWCLEQAGNEVSGLAMYNAGTNRVKKGTTPKVTLDYVNRILSFRAGIDALLADEMSRSWFMMADGSVRSISPGSVQMVANVTSKQKGFFRSRSID